MLRLDGASRLTLVVVDASDDVAAESTSRLAPQTAEDAHTFVWTS